MPRKDPTFTDGDLIRFFCRNLDPAEKTRVLNRFKAHILNHEPLCGDDDKINIDFCKWAKRFWDLTSICEDVAGYLPRVLATLGSLLGAIELLSWAGWIGRLLLIVRALLLFLINAIIYIGAVLAMVGQLKPFAEAAVQMFCFAQYDVNPEGEPPDPANLPESPGEIINDILNDIRDWFNEPFSPDTTTPPSDPWPPELPF